MSATIASTIGALSLLWAARQRLVPAWRNRPAGVRLWQVSRWLRPRIDLKAVRENIWANT